MKQFLSKQLQNKFTDVRKSPKTKTFKMLMGLSFLVGFLLFLFLGSEFCEELSLLDVASLQEIKDNTINKGDFLGYILSRRLLLLAAGSFLWWWGFGKWYVYGLLAGLSFTMGACMYISLMRYHVMGLFLWFFLYFPHVICYAGVLFCGMIIARYAFKTRIDKVKYLWQNGMLITVLLAMLALGIYCESYVNVALLQSFLQYF